MPKYYSTDLTIPIIEIMAETKEQAEAIINEFIDQISPVMELKIRWEECDWEMRMFLMKPRVNGWSHNA